MKVKDGRKEGEGKEWRRRREGMKTEEDGKDDGCLERKENDREKKRKRLQKVRKII